MKACNLIIGRKENLKREIASLTKIMTFYTVIDLLDRFKLHPDEVKIEVGYTATQVSGTSAFLKHGDVLSVT
jgi:D-alanyl-D-alanine carboxypeptidase (penicillin-binding protein 5/6)